jgi:hypothetical protein
MKILPLGPKLFHADGQIHDGANSRYSQICERSQKKKEEEEEEERKISRTKEKL